MVLLIKVAEGILVKSAMTFKGVNFIRSPRKFIEAGVNSMMDKPLMRWFNRKAPQEVSQGVGSKLMAKTTKSIVGSPSGITGQAFPGSGVARVLPAQSPSMAMYARNNPTSVSAMRGAMNRRNTIAHEAFHAKKPDPASWYNKVPEVKFMQRQVRASESAAYFAGGWSTPRNASKVQRLGSGLKEMGHYLRHGTTGLPQY